MALNSTPLPYLALTTSAELLATLLPQWHALLREWAGNGSLAASAQEALLLESEPEALQQLVEQWAAGDFRALPEIELLSDANINAAMGAYAVSTGKIYLNADWMNGASPQQVFAVLTEELGHHLDGLLNAVDTPGDEGEYFSYLLLDNQRDITRQASLRTQIDSGEISASEGKITVELASYATTSTGQYQKTYTLPTAIFKRSSPSINTAPSSGAKIITNTISSLLTGVIFGSEYDDIIQSISEDQGHTSIGGLVFTDTKGNLFINAEGPITNGGPNGSIGNSSFNIGDGYTQMQCTIFQGNYNRALLSSEMKMGAGDSDINITIRDGVYWDQTSMDSSSIQSGDGIDCLNVVVGSTFWGTHMCGIRGSTIDQGRGNDTLSVIAKRQPENTQGGWITGIDYTQVQMGEGDDYVGIESNDFEFNVSDSTDKAVANSKINLGNGNDLLEVIGTYDGIINDTYDAIANILLGEGDDTMYIRSTRGYALKNANIDGGGGNDIAIIDGLFTSTQIDLGPGYDVLWICGNRADYVTSDNKIWLASNAQNYIDTKNIESVVFSYRAPGQTIEYTSQDAPSFVSQSLSLGYLDTGFSSSLPASLKGQLNATVLNGGTITYGPTSSSGTYGSLAVTSTGSTTFTGNSAAITTRSTSTLADSFSVTASNGGQTATAKYNVAIANPSAENSLLITATASGAIDGINFGSTASSGAYAGKLLNSINLGTAADTATLTDAAGTTAALTLNGGSGFDRLNGNASANKLTLTGLDSGTLDQVAFSSIENIYLQGGNDTVTIAAGGRLSGILDGGAGSNTLIVDPSLTIGFGDGGTITIGGGAGSFSGFQNIQGGGSSGGSSGGLQTNSLTLNSNSNVVAITGPNSGTVEGTAFTNLSDINLAAGDDNAILAAVGSLTGALSGGSGIDDLTLNASANSLKLDHTGAGTATSNGNPISTAFSGFEVIRLDSGSDRADLSFSATTALTAKQQLRLDGGIDNDTIAINLSPQELQNLQTSNQRTALDAYLAAPTGKTITVNFLQTSLTLSGFETGIFKSTEVSLAVTPSTVTEDGTSSLIYTFYRTGATTNSLSVNYSISGSADAADYTGATPGSGKTINFAAGSATAILKIDPTTDSNLEADETVALTLASGTGYTIGTATAVVGSIANDDLPVINLALSPASVTEGGTTNLVYTFTRTGTTTNPLTVNYTVSGTATLGSDYTGISTTGTTKTVTFDAGFATTTVRVDPIADTDVEANETVALTPATGTGYRVGTATAVVGTISNDDFNSSPTALNLSANSFAENIPAGSAVANLFTTDPDAGNTFTYALVAGTGSADNAAFSISGNQLKINASPNFEDKSAYSIRVRTTDQGGLFFEKTLTLAATNANELPTDITASALNFAENIPAGSAVANLSTTDPDAGNTFTYALVAGTGSADNAAFSISGNQLKIIASPNFEAKSAYSVRVRTTDQGGLFFEKNLTLAATNVNELPTDIAASTLNFAENIPAGSTVANLSTTDPDAGNTFTYALVAGTGSADNAAFAISGNQLKINASPNFEDKSAYSIRVRTTDQGGLFFEKNLSLAATNVNERPTDIAVSTLNFAENIPAGSAVANLSTSDPDAGNTFTYALVAGTGSNDNAAFKIDGSQLKITASPDFETNSSYTIRFRSTDSGGLNHEKSVTLKVNNLQEGGSLGASTSSLGSTFQEGIRLTAGTLSDPDGISGPVTYKWFKGSTEVQSDSSTSHAVGAQAAGTYRCEATYQDGTGSIVTAVSTNQAVNSINNGNGTIGSVGSSVPGIFREGVTLTAPKVTGDPDGEAANPNYTYQWFKDNSPIGGVNGNTYGVPANGSGVYRVAITYTDGQGATATVNSQDQLVSVSNSGNGTAGPITSSVPGLFREGVTLTTPKVTGDPDGDAANPNYSFQWFKDNSPVESATANTYGVPANGSGVYRVAIKYSDAQGASGIVNSPDQSVAVFNNGNGTAGSITSSVPGLFREGVTLTAPKVTGDPDGDAGSPNYSYQWFKDNAAIGSANANTYGVAVNGPGIYRVAITYSDAQGATATVNSPDQSVAVFNNGNGTAGSISSSLAGVFREGVTLTAPIVTGDPDGDATNPNYSYRWFKDNAPIGDGGAKTYQVPANGSGVYRVSLTYRDAQGGTATVDSADQFVSAYEDPSDSSDPSDPLELQPGRTCNLPGLRDYDGNLHGGAPDSLKDSIAADYRFQGFFSLRRDGLPQALFTNRSSGRWASAAVDPLTRQIDYADNGKGGITRVVGIYDDPLVKEGEQNTARPGYLLSGEVAPKRFGPFDSQRRFQNDLLIDNLSARLSGDFDRDGIQELYWKVNDGTAYLRSLLHDDGNIRYANYQSRDQMSSYLTSNGHADLIGAIL